MGQPRLHDRSQDGGLIEPGQRGQIVTGMGQVKAHLGHQFVQPQPSAQMREDRPDLRVMPAKGSRLPGPDVSLARVFMPDGLRRVPQHEQAGLVQDAGQAPGLFLVGDIDVLPLRKQLPDPNQAGIGAAQDLLGGPPCQRGNEAEAAQPVGMLPHTLDDVVVAQLTEPQVPKGEAAHDGTLDVVAFHTVQQVLERGPPVHPVMGQGVEIGLAQGQGLRIPDDLRRIHVNMEIDGLHSNGLPSAHS